MEQQRDKDGTRPLQHGHGKQVQVLFEGDEACAEATERVAEKGRGSSAANGGQSEHEQGLLGSKHGEGVGVGGEAGAGSRGARRERKGGVAFCVSWAGHLEALRLPWSAI